MILNLEDVKALGGRVTEDHHGEVLHLPQGATGTAKAQVTRDDGVEVWQDVGGAYG